MSLNVSWMSVMLRGGERRLAVVQHDGRLPILVRHGRRHAADRLLAAASGRRGPRAAAEAEREDSRGGRGTCAKLNSCIIEKQD